MKNWKDGAREKSQQPGRWRRSFSVQTRNKKRKKEGLKKTNSRGSGGDLSANTHKKKSIPKKLQVNNKERRKENRVDQMTTQQNRRESIIVGYC